LLTTETSEDKISSPSHDSKKETPAGIDNSATGQARSQHPVRRKGARFEL